MKTPPPDPSKPFRASLARGAEGYLSLVFTAVLLVIPFLPRLIEPFETVIGLAVLFLVLVLGLRGSRTGHGGGRIAAWLSLAVLVVVFICLASYACLLFLRDIPKRHH
jgi:hypothetical protein